MPQARALLADKVPADKVVVPSKGNKNPAVLRYDPTGLRSAMSATNAEMEKSIQVGHASPVGCSLRDVSVRADGLCRWHATRGVLYAASVKVELPWHLGVGHLDMK